MNLRQDRVAPSANLGVLDEIYATPTKRPPRRATADYRAQVLLLSLAGLTLAAGGLAFAQLRHDLTRPRAQLLASVTPAGGPPAASATAPAVADTDGDGLTDDEEVAVGTSRYLEDTDSDGIGDAQEIAAKTNPTCAQGRLCELLPAASAAGDGLAATAAPPTPAGQSELRIRLAGLGISPAILESLGDDELTRIFGSALATTPAPEAAAVAPVNRSATPTDLRAWLTQQGVPADLLNGVSDAELRQLVDESRPSATP